MTVFTVRSWLARIADGIGLALLAALLAASLLGGSREFENDALWLGVGGTLICWLTPAARRNLPLPLVGLVLFGIASAAAHRHPGAPSWSWMDRAWHLPTMLVFIYGAAHLLRTPMRLAVLAIGILAAVNILGAQIAFDRVRTAFQYERIGSSSIPLVAQWGSLHQTGMVLLVALPFALAATLVNRARLSMAAGATISAGLFVFGYVNGSRTGVLAMALVAAVMGVVALSRSFSLRRSSVWMAALLLLVSAGLVYAVFSNRTSMPIVRSLTGDRWPIWTAASHMTLDHPLWGVGPGRFTEAMIVQGYAYAHFPWYPYNRGGVEQAHNIVLHTAAELGVVGAVFLVALWYTLIAACWHAWRAQVIPLIALGYCGALAAFFVRAQADNFLDNLVTTDRTRVLIWALLAAALAIQRLAQAQMSK